eukprot:CAMPEP_0185034718 /NCGR_PEP_ID=MMETSP1103-20130426/24832_1 /TAXON_ID=36769 /ORGANISM="Paraphysomonas bandaiensis, Strain Caron Lab Isolate" /LENGTH=158 /DNA_ID=CAMNT_0027571485 /DNA_START=140 /DNA_END=616 /DNA_ORIENTATION=+
MIVIYAYFVVVQLGSVVSLLVGASKNLSDTLIKCAVMTLMMGSGAGFILVFLFSAPSVRYFSCCIYDLQFLEGVTSEMQYQCGNTTCGYRAISVVVPLFVYTACAVLSNLQIHNIYRYLHEIKIEYEHYDRLVHTTVVADTSFDPENEMVQTRNPGVI